MVTAGEYRIEKIVAVWKDDGTTHVLSLCGRCREFIQQIDAGNLDTEVVLGKGDTSKSKELLPRSDRSEPLG
jgi:cytidine deaminase